MAGRGHAEASWLAQLRLDMGVYGMPFMLHASARACKCGMLSPVTPVIGGDHRGLRARRLDEAKAKRAAAADA